MTIGKKQKCYSKSKNAQQKKEFGIFKIPQTLLSKSTKHKKIIWKV